MIDTAQNSSINSNNSNLTKRPSVQDVLEMQTRSGRRIQSTSNKRFKQDIESNLELFDNSLYQNLNPIDLFQFNMPSEDEEDEDYKLPAKSPPPILSTLLQPQPVGEPKRKGRRRAEGTEEERRQRRLESQRITAAKIRKRKNERMEDLDSENNRLNSDLKEANNRIEVLEKDLRDAKLHIYKLENETNLITGLKCDSSGQRHPLIRNLLQAVQMLIKATDVSKNGEEEVLDRVDEEEAALTDENSLDND